MDRKMSRLERKLKQVLLADSAAAMATDALMARWYNDVEGVFHEAMTVSGCHQHKRMWAT
jgi:hypothetical protein